MIVSLAGNQHFYYTCSLCEHGHYDHCVGLTGSFRYKERIKILATFVTPLGDSGFKVLMRVLQTYSMVALPICGTVCSGITG